MGYLRETTEDDADLLFEWTNDASVRENSFSTDEISYDEHIRWFHHMLADDTIRQYIYMHEGEPAGQIRITIDGQTAEIGYSICKEKRGMGLGKEMVALLAVKIEEDYPQVKKLKAKVKPDNMASRSIFLNSGYDWKYCLYEADMNNIVKNLLGGVNIKGISFHLIIDYLLPDKFCVMDFG